MANAVWPVALPQDVFVGYRERLPDVAIRYPMDGAAIIRPRFTDNVRPFDVTVELIRNVAAPASDHILIFRTFFNVTLIGGTQPFDWVDPHDVSPVTFKFRVGDGYVPELAHQQGNRFLVALALEVLP